MCRIAGSGMYWCIFSWGILFLLPVFDYHMVHVLVQWWELLLVSSSYVCFFVTHWGRGNIFSRQHFEMDFLEWKCMNLDKNSLKFFPKVPINNIGSDNGLVPARRQAIIWTNAGIGWWVVTHICVTRPQWVNRKLSIGSSNGSVLNQCQSITWAN